MLKCTGSWSVSLSVAAGILCGVSGCGKGTGSSKSEGEGLFAKPKAVAKTFLTAFRAKNMDGVLHVSTTPFLIEIDSTKQARIIENSNDLRTELAKLMNEWPNLAEFPTEIVEVGEWGHNGIPREELEKQNNLQDKVRDYGGYYVIPAIAAGPDAGSRAKMKVLLKVVDGQPRVVGFVTGDDQSMPY